MSHLQPAEASGACGNATVKLCRLPSRGPPWPNSSLSVLRQPTNEADMLAGSIASADMAPTALLRSAIIQNVSRQGLPCSFFEGMYFVLHVWHWEGCTCSI